VLIAIGNSGDAGLAPLVESLLTDAAPLVRGIAVWALIIVASAGFALIRADRFQRLSSHN